MIVSRGTSLELIHMSRLINDYKWGSASRQGGEQLTYDARETLDS